METTLYQRKELRKITSSLQPSAEAARHVLVSGCKDQGVYAQFRIDLHVSGLYSALLSAESYEKGNSYDKGTTEKALAAAIKLLPDEPPKASSILDMDAILEAAELDNGAGFCKACGEETDCCEPDARNYTCPSCGKKEVFGAAELLF